MKFKLIIALVTNDKTYIVTEAARRGGGRSTLRVPHTGEPAAL